MPDWRNPEDYAYTEKLRLHDWAWEFLRRNPAYRLAWDRFLIIAAADKRAYLDAGGLGSAWPVSEELNAAWDSASKDFGLVAPINPDLSAAETSEVSWREAVGITVLEEWAPVARENRPWPGYPRAIALAFDFTRPLKPQITQAADVLERCVETLRRHGVWEDDPKPKVRVERSRFTLYLRLLDASQDGATLGEMGRQLFELRADKRDSVKNALQTAKSMTATGYRDLLLKANL